jgi:hypothetical protein
LAITRDTRNAHDFAFTDFKRGLGQPNPSAGARNVDLIEPQHSPSRRLWLASAYRNLPPDHQRSQHGPVGPRDWSVCDLSAAAQNGNAVGNCENLPQLV